MLGASGQNCPHSCWPWAWGACPTPAPSRGRPWRRRSPHSGQVWGQHLSLKFTWPGLESSVTKRNTGVSAPVTTLTENGIAESSFRGQQTLQGQSRPWVPQTDDQGSGEACGVPSVQGQRLGSPREPAPPPVWGGPWLRGRAPHEALALAGVWVVWKRCFKPWHPAASPGCSHHEAQRT